MSQQFVAYSNFGYLFIGYLPIAIFVANFISILFDENGSCAKLPWWVKV